MIDGTSAMEPDNGTVFVTLLFPPEKKSVAGALFSLSPDQNGTYREKRPTQKSFHPSMLQHYIPPKRSIFHQPTKPGTHEKEAFILVAFNYIGVNGVSSPTILLIKRMVIRRGKSSMEAESPLATWRLNSMQQKWGRLDMMQFVELTS